MLTPAEQKRVIDFVYQTKDLILKEMEQAKVTEKGSADFVTNVDVSVQEFLIKELHTAFPEIDMIAEEKENLDLSEGKRYWILDPIDGTTNLIYDYRMSAVSLGLYEYGEITMGIVYNPFMDEMFTAVKGEGAYLNGVSIHTSEEVALRSALISYGSCPYEKSRAKEFFPILERIFVNCADFRRTGSAAIDFCYVACGRQHGFFELNLKPWDYAAGSLIVQEAGGVVTNWNAQKLPFLKNSDVFVSTKKIETELRALL